jgi:hypothetical protein
MLLICRDPSYLYVNVSEAARGVIDEAEERRLREAVLAKFKQRQYDAGLLGVVQQLREALAHQRP